MLYTADLNVGGNANIYGLSVTSGGLNIVGPSGAGATSILNLNTYDPLGDPPPASIVGVDDGAYSASVQIRTKTPGAWANSSVTRFIVTSDGKVGIGSFSNPQDSLHVLGDMRVYNGSNVSDAGGAIRFGTSNNPTFGEMAAIKGIYFSSNATNFAGGLAFFTRSNNATSNTTLQERMRITHHGNVLIGTSATTCNFRLQIGTDSAGKPGTNTWTISSDVRIKEDVVSANVGICYSNVKNIPLKYFKWRDDIYTTDQVRDRHKLGWIAQDVEIVFPKAVDIMPMFGYPDCRSLNSDQIIASMYGAVQHIQDITETQNEREAARLQLQTLEIPHPVIASATLVHSAVYAPRCDVLYRGKVVLSDGNAQIDLDTCAPADPTNGLVAGATFEAMLRNAQTFLQNDSGFARLRGSIVGGVLNIECEDSASTDEVSWMVVAERKDAYVMGGADGKTNAAGYLNTVRIS